jgi:type VI protein secretion system component VasK
MTLTLHWPGPAPELGFEIAFDGGSGVERQSARGPWGLLHFLDGLRLRPRDGGKRFLIDIRLKSSRNYLQMTFDSAANPVSGRALMRGLSCPPSL